MKKDYPILYNKERNIALLIFRVVENRDDNFFY